MDPITLAMGLAQFAPKIVKWITGSDNAAAGAQKVVDIAGQVTGLSGDPEKMLEALQADKALQIQFQQRVMENDTELERLFLADTQNARARDVALAQAGIRNYRASLLVAVAVLLVLICLTVTVWSSNANDFVKATVTLVMGRALGWVDQVFSFEFGTTRANKTKDDTIRDLAR
ncbi:hypothetical protein ACFJIX_18055 [Roseateles sp. UC29_93]|uniref:hypothetical protein n=1 Tax=Roseateles sp. UC29_93 TaxID=3350177 RepID=UPI00366DE4E1